MSVLVALLPDETARSRLLRVLRIERQAGALHAIHFAETWRELRDCTITRAPQVVIFDPYYGGRLALHEWSSFRAAFPSVVLLPYSNFKGRPAADLLLLARLGVHQAITYDVDDDAASLQRLLTEAISATVIESVVQQLQDRLTPDLVRLLRHLLSHTHEKLDPAAAARVCYQDQSTLRRTLRAAGLPSPRRLIIWTRLFHAAHLLEDPGRRVENVALVLNFASVSALGNQLKRYANTRPQQLIARGGLAYLLHEFRRQYGGELPYSNMDESARESTTGPAAV